MTYKNKVVFVTGGAQGIGRAICVDYAKEGASVLISDIDEDAGKELESELIHNGLSALFIKTDVSKESDILNAFKICVEKFKTVDILINNAGVGGFKGLLESSTELWDKIISINLRGAYICSREAAKVMAEKNSGNIINIASTRAFMSESDTEAYSASKGGIIALTHSMAVSLGHKGIRVNSISPGWIETCTHQKSSTVSTPSHSMEDKMQHPVGRVGTPEDISKACMFLTSDNATFITGTNLTIDGGMTIKMIYV